MDLRIIILIVSRHAQLYSSDKKLFMFVCTMSCYQNGIIYFYYHELINSVLYSSPRDKDEKGYILDLPFRPIRLNVDRNCPENISNTAEHI
jgi:hypothetical protein